MTAIKFEDLKAELIDKMTWLLNHSVEQFNGYAKSQETNPYDDEEFITFFESFYSNLIYNSFNILLNSVDKDNKLDVLKDMLDEVKARLSQEWLM